MPFLRSSTPFDNDIEKATSENNTEADWGYIINICDNVNKIPDGHKICINSLKKRLRSQIPNVVLQTLTVLDSCVINCGQAFKLEIATKDFSNELKYLITKGHGKVSLKAKELIKKWAHDFKDDPALFLIPSLYNQLLRDGISFGSPKTAKKVLKTNNPDFVESKEEEEDIAKAIHLSLKDSKMSTVPVLIVKPDDISSLLYPSTNPTISPGNLNYGTIKKLPIPLARALYDFEAVEDNEISFKCGDKVFVLDSSDSNWWRGKTGDTQKEGLFPATFVKFIKNEEDDMKEFPIASDELRNSVVNGKDSIRSANIIDENVLDECLTLLHLADPTGKIEDPTEMFATENKSLAMSSLIDQELEKVDDCHAKLFELNRKLNEAFKFYNYLLTPVSAVNAANMLHNQSQQPTVSNQNNPPETFQSPPIMNNLQNNVNSPYIAQNQEIANTIPSYMYQNAAQNFHNIDIPPNYQLADYNNQSVSMNMPNPTFQPSANIVNSIQPPHQ
ncbi:unnamed protein product [Gordionus sp. m RMFG-2023]|uniref:signal transducing adapter molecule 2-like isoform X2 n=1 Tax=Gordionus sp. m RMFG-2023 TaxID=3053472 RepID=UPI0030DF1856